SYAVFTHPRGEAKVQPPFPCYPFSGIGRESMRWRPILSTTGVADAVRAGDEPVSVPSRIGAAFRAREKAGHFDRLVPQRSLRLGELVRVTAGAFEDMVGTLVELCDQDRIVVLLGWLGCLVRAELQTETVEAA